MQQYAASFCALMSNFVTVYQSLLSLAKEKTGILVQGDVQKLEALLAQETEFVIAAGKLEKQRSGLLKEWSTAAGWKPVELNTQFVVEQLEASHKELVEAKVIELKQVIDELREANNANGELIDHALQFVNYSLELLSGQDAGGMTYGANGYLGDRQGYKILDQKV